MKSGFMKKAIVLMVTLAMLLTDMAPVFASGTDAQPDETAVLCVNEQKTCEDECEDGTCEGQFEQENCPCEEENCGSCAENDAAAIQENISLTEDSLVNVEVSDEMAEEINQTMTRISEMMEAGQIVYDEKRNILVLTDPEADLTGLPISGIEVIEAEDNSEVNEAPAENEAVNEEAAVPAEESEAPAEEPALPEGIPADGMVLPAGSTSEGVTLNEEILTEGAILNEDVLTDSAILSEEVLTDGAIQDAEAELTWFWDEHHYETAAYNVVIYNNYKKGRSALYTIYNKGSVVEYIDYAWSGIVLLSDKFYKVKYRNGSTVRTGWVLASNIKEVTCAGPETSNQVISGKNASSHTIYTHYAAVYCSKCKKLLEAEKNSSKKTQSHSWNSVGKCTVCGYEYTCSVSSMPSTLYNIKSAASARKTPYEGGAYVKSYTKGTVITVGAKTKNALGQTWYRTSAGDWVRDSYLELHSHEFDISDGLCKTCHAECNSYSITAMSTAKYYANKGNVTLRKRPYEGAASAGTLTQNYVVSINGSTNNAPWGIGGFLGIGRSYGDKWYRTTSGYWVKSTDVNVHDKHVISASSCGVCTYNGCGYKETITETWLLSGKIGVMYETGGKSVNMRREPYDTSTVARTLPAVNQVIAVYKSTKNGAGQTWYKTGEGYWIKSCDIAPHSHRLFLGCCTVQGCNYMADITTRKINPVILETKTSATFRTKPYDNAPSAGVKPAGYCFSTAYIVTPTDTKKDWYLTTDAQFVRTDQVKEHKHSFVDGYCKACDSYAPFVTQGIEAKLVKVSQSSVVPRVEPYTSGNSTGQTLSKGTQVIITGYATNLYLERWYNVQGYGWVPKTSLCEKTGGTVATTQKDDNETFQFRIVDTNNNPLRSAVLNLAGAALTCDEDGYITVAYTADSLSYTASMTGYDTISASGFEMSAAGGKKVITLSKTGAYDPLEVVMDYLGESKDLLKESVKINKYHTQELFAGASMNFTCKAAPSVQVGRYELVQESKVIRTSTSGVFSSLKATDFTENKTVQLKIYDKSGCLRSTRNLLLNVYNEGANFSDSLGGMLGLGSAKLSLPQSVPIVGGLEISIDPKAIFKVYVEVDDESVKHVINVDPKKLVKEKDISKWTSYAEYKKAFETLKKNGLSWTKWSEFNKNEIADAAKEKKSPFSVSVSGYLEKILGEDTHKGCLSVSVTWKVSGSNQFMAGPVPIVLGYEIKAKATVGGNITITNAKLVSFTLPLDITASIEGSAGVGLQYVATVSIYGSVTMKLAFQLIPWNPSKINLSLYGTIGLKVEVLGFEIVNWPFLNTPVLDIVKDGKWALWEYEDFYDYLNDPDNWALADRSYLRQRGEWYDADAVSLFGDCPVVVDANFDYSVLQRHAYTDIKPQIISAGDTIMMVYADDEASRAAVDRTMLVYSIYDTEGKCWSEPQPVCNDGTADYSFSLAADGGDIYIAWQNAKTCNAPDASMADVASNVEIMAAKYDKAANIFDHAEQITGNDDYEFMPRIAHVNGETLVTWVTNSENNILNLSGSNRIHYAVKSDADYAPENDYAPMPEEDDQLAAGDLEDALLPDDSTATEICEEEIITPWTITDLASAEGMITSLALGNLEDGSYIAYTTDEDGNEMTADDQSVWLIDTEAPAAVIPFADDASNVEFAKISGSDAMTWYNRGMVYYTTCGQQKEFRPLYNEETSIGTEYQLISDDDGSMAILYTLNGENSSDAYMVLYDPENQEWGYPIRLSEQGEYIKDMKGTYVDGLIVSVFNWITADEETLAEENTLCSIAIGDRHDIVLSDVVCNTYDLTSGEAMDTAFTVRNNGTCRLSGVTAIVKDAEGNEIYREVFETPVRTGESVEYTMGVLMPENLEKQTLYLYVEALGQDADLCPDNNVAPIEIGAADLYISAEAGQEGDRNVVTVTVVNRGYEPMGGSLAMLDDNGDVDEILVENFEPIGHDEKYSCTIELDTDSFGSDPTELFSFGVIPTGKTAPEFTTDISVKPAQERAQADIAVGQSMFNTDENGVALCEVSEDEPVMNNIISGTVRNQTLKDVASAVLYVTVYDGRGTFLDVYEETVSITAEEEYAFEAVFGNDLEIASARICLLDAETLEPLCDVTDLRVVTGSRTLY